MDPNDNSNMLDSLSSKNIHPSLVAGMTIRVEIISGKDLVPKDRPNRSIMTGMKRLSPTTSDPYVQLKYQNLNKYGSKKSRTIPKNCINPTWNETLEIKFNANEARDCLQLIYHSPYYNNNNNNNSTTTSTAATATTTTIATEEMADSVRQSQLLLGLPTIDCFIYDKDVLTFDDPMGIVQIPLTLDHIHDRHRTAGSSSSSGTHNNTGTTIISTGPQWYTVCTHQVYCHNHYQPTNHLVTHNEFCNNATGELYINVHVETQWMVPMIHNVVRTTPDRTPGYQLYPSSTSDNVSGHYTIEIGWATTTPTTVVGHPNIGSSSLPPPLPGHETMMDTACIAIDERNGKISWEHCVYYHNPNTSSTGIYSTGSTSTLAATRTEHSTTTTMSGGHNSTDTTTTMWHTATYSVTLPLIPSHIRMLYWGVFVSEPPVQRYLTHDVLSTMTFRVLHHDTKIGVAAYTVYESMTLTGSSSSTESDNSKATALILAQFVRYPNMEQTTKDGKNNDIWCIRPVPPSPSSNTMAAVDYSDILATYSVGRDFGTMIPELKQLVYDSQMIPNMTLDPSEPRIGLIRKGGIIRMNDYIRQSEALMSSDAWNFACRWDNSTIQSVNVQRRQQEQRDDAPKLPALKYEMQALLFSGEDHTNLNFECIEQIQHSRPQSNFDHSVQVGDKMLGHEEYMSIRLSKLPKYVTCVAFTVQLQTTMGEVGTGAGYSLWNFVNHIISFQIRHPITNQVIAKYQQPTESTLFFQNSLFVACLYRTKESNNQEGDDDDAWCFHIVDDSMDKSTNATTTRVRNIVETLYDMLHNKQNTKNVTKPTIKEEEQDIVF